MLASDLLRDDVLSRAASADLADLEEARRLAGLAAAELSSERRHDPRPWRFAADFDQAETLARCALRLGQHILAEVLRDRMAAERNAEREAAQ
jgi:hypothetical protein